MPLKVTILPLSRIVHIRDEDHAVLLLKETQPELDTHALVRADAVGRRVRSSPATSVGLEWEATLAAQELRFMADWIGRAVGATYTIVRHVV